MVTSPNRGVNLLRGDCVAPLPDEQIAGAFRHAHRPWNRSTLAAVERE